MYLRDRESLGEGDELEFEHHLVSIEDFSGSVNQDLTPIFSPALQRKQVCTFFMSGFEGLTDITRLLLRRHLQFRHLYRTDGENQRGLRGVE